MFIGEKILDYQDEIVRHLSELIRIPSVAGDPADGMPFGLEANRALDYMLDLSARFGFRTVNLDGFAGYAEYGDGEETAAVAVHLDVVPEGGGWTVPPFGGAVLDGKVYGRGASDNKGPAVAALFCLKMLKDQGVPFRRRFRLIFGINEESGMHDMDYYLKKEKLPDIAFSPDAGYPAINGEMGILRVILTQASHPDASCAEGGSKSSVVRIEGGHAANMVPDHCSALLGFRPPSGPLLERLTQKAGAYDVTGIVTVLDDEHIRIDAAGKSAHGAAPSAGINAIAHLLRFADQEGLLHPDDRLALFLSRRLGFDYSGKGLKIDMTDEWSSPLTINLGIIDISRAGGYAIADIRYPVSASGEDLLVRLNLAADEYDLDVTVKDHLVPLYVDPDSPVVRLLNGVYTKMTGLETKPVTIAGGSYARKFPQRCVLFGGAGANGHQPDEQVAISQLMDHAKISAQAIYEMVQA